MGPEGGVGGGRVVAEGTPEAIASNEESHTGTFLRGILGPERIAAASVKAGSRTAKPRKRAAAGQ
jgi:excinuclease ABC subunit A